MIELAHAAAQPAAQNSFFNFLPMILIIGVFYFLMIRPQQKREKARQTMISELKTGDRVLLVSGFYGKVIKTGDRVFTIEIGTKGVQVEVERNAIANKVDANGQATTTPEKAKSE